MKKKIISASLLAFFFAAKLKAQDTTTENTSYQKQKLKIEQINLLSSYYTQDGNNSAVTGGIGTEKLNDQGVSFDIQISKLTKKNNKHNFYGEIGVDTYTSASSDKIDPNTISSASSSDVRIYPSLNYVYENNQHNYTLNSGVSASTEFDYQSIGVNGGFSKLSKDKNREFSIKAMAFFDTWKVILPIELRTPSVTTNGKRRDNYPSSPRNSFSLNLALSQVINKSLQIVFLTDVGYQNGLLGTKFHRVYFNDGSLAAENLPDKRFKIPFGIRANYYLGDNIVLRNYYRYYWDDWGINSHTYSFEPSYKFSAFSSLSIPYRIYTQTAAKYFQPYQMHSIFDDFYTSDYDLSKFTSHMIGISYKIIDSNKGLFRLKHLNTIELRYGYYTRSNGLDSHIFTLALKLK